MAVCLFKLTPLPVLDVLVMDFAVPGSPEAEGQRKLWRTFSTACTATTGNKDLSPRQAQGWPFFV